MSGIFRLIPHKSWPIEFVIKLYKSLEIGNSVLKDNDIQSAY